MDEKEATIILRNFADAEFQEWWKVYCQSMLDGVHESMEYKHENIDDLRGQAKILRRFMKLRDTAVAVLHKGN